MRSYARLPGNTNVKTCCLVKDQQVNWQTQNTGKKLIIFYIIRKQREDYEGCLVLKHMHYLQYRSMH